MKSLITLCSILFLSGTCYSQTSVPVQLPPITIPQFNITVPTYDASPLEARIQKLESAIATISTSLANLSAELSQLYTVNAVDDNYEMTEDDQQLVVAAPGVLANDNYVVQLNDGTILKEKSILGPVKITITKQPEHGTVTINDDGSFVYTPHPKQAQ